MKFTLTFLFASIFIFVALLVVLFWGKTLPTSQKTQASIDINAPAEMVWDAMVAWEQQPLWRDDIRAVRIIDSGSFVERRWRGPRVTFRVVKSQPPTYLELAMSGPLIGVYQARLSQTGGVTTVAVYEMVAWTTIFQRIRARWFFDLDAFANAHLMQLAAYVETQRAVQSAND